MKRATNQSGYVGVLMILVGTALLVFLMTKVYLTPNKNTSELQPNNADGTVPTTQVERSRATIDKAADIAKQQSEAAAETNRMINSVQ